MKKNIKILVGILISIIIVLIVYVVLIIKQIVPNPFLDTKDLVCSRETKLPNYVEQEILRIKFNKDATIKEYDEIYKIIYESVEELNSYKEYLDSNKIDYTYNEIEKSLEIVDQIKILEENNYYKKTKKEMKNIFLNELHYDECE